MGRLRGPCAYPRIARLNIQALPSQSRKLRLWKGRSDVTPGRIFSVENRRARWAAKAAVIFCWVFLARLEAAPFQNRDRLNWPLLVLRYLRVYAVGPGGDPAGEVVYFGEPRLLQERDCLRAAAA